MALRTNKHDVEEILGNTILSGSAMISFITTANLIVTKIYAGDTTMTEALLTEIEKYYTAHLIACTVQRTTTDEKIGDAQVTYAGKFGTKLEMTPYGQVILSLDITGKMVNAGKMQASMYAIKSFDDTIV